jgi:hypothetical protein
MMHTGYEGADNAVVRAELCARLESLQALSMKLSTRAFTENIEGIRTLAAAYGLSPVVRLAEALERAIGETDTQSQRASPTALYLSRLHDAIGCDRVDERASEAMLASVAVRLCA